MVAFPKDEFQAPIDALYLISELSCDLVLHVYVSFGQWFELIYGFLVSFQGVVLKKVCYCTFFVLNIGYPKSHLRFWQYY